MIERGETCVRITFCPSLQDQSAFPSSGIMANFVVQNEVAFEDIVGDVHVIGPAEWKVGSGVRQSRETRRWPPRGTCLFLPGDQ